ncbi:hypothetical protein GYMLUDRAFT_61831 [Collybiopsis luxurians FD-317 M1]|uniref:Uncharacterized protein n=1 Tax=Collybiopsis luxurians FD-317 M1 TaxID=944289 RepID=A0A0D0C376_9AGAR|nr:hypothetical protein GYMLUDRAFT_61831 [Collybiopsis luxurians FD-317 M1]
MEETDLSLSPQGEYAGGNEEYRIESPVERKPLRIMRVVRTCKELFHDAYENPTIVEPSFYSALVSSRDVEAAATRIIMQSSFCSPQSDHADWVNFAEHVEKNDFRCIWGGCKYRAQKPLVRRSQISKSQAAKLTLRLQVKQAKLTAMYLPFTVRPFICRFCDRKFSQVFEHSKIPECWLNIVCRKALEISMLPPSIPEIVHTSVHSMDVQKLSTTLQIDIIIKYDSTIISPNSIPIPLTTLSRLNLHSEPCQENRCNIRWNGFSAFRVQSSEPLHS